MRGERNVHSRRGVRSAGPIETLAAGAWTASAAPTTGFDQCRRQAGVPSWRWRPFRARASVRALSWVAMGGPPRSRRRVRVQRARERVAAMVTNEARRVGRTVHDLGRDARGRHARGSGDPRRRVGPSDL